jgi:diguanylate cyclase (GGDEF)-like protein
MLTSQTATMFAAFLAQAFGAAALAAVLQGFHRHYRRDYLRQWTLSWCALAVHFLALAVSIPLATEYASTHPLRIVTAATGLAAGYLQVGWLLFGTYTVATGRGVRRRQMVWILAGLAAVAGLALVTTQDPFVQFGLRGLVAGLAFVVAGVLVRPPHDRPNRLGRGLVATGFLAYGAQLLHYFGLALVPLFGAPLPSYASYLGFADLLLQAVIGLGMVIWLLEEERREQVQSAEQVEFLSYHDPLTGLPNRQRFFDRLAGALEQADRTGHKVAVIFLDLDRFREVNDCYGYSLGDQVMRVVAGRLRRTAGDGDTVARRGGDEFSILLPALDDDATAVDVAGKLLAAMRLPLVVHDREFIITSSFGVAVYPHDGGDPETLVRRADLALYRAKAMGRDTLQFYAPGMETGSPERMDLERDLRRALAQREIRLHYQPLVDLKTLRVTGVEALVRWHHPKKGLLLPAEFLPLAEAIGMMSTLEMWILREACRQTRAWQKDGLRDFRVSVNLSSRPFQRPELVGWVQDTLTDTGLSPESLELEITERTAMQDVEASQQVLKNLKDHGVRVAIDDFGTGYSSLSYLRTFPIDTLKIDQVFVRDLAADPRLAKTVIALAHSLGLKVVAEGVETERQRSVLTEDDCDEAQGFLFSRPVPAAACGKFLNVEFSSTPV